MTAHTLEKILAEALAEVGVGAAPIRLPSGRPRETKWLHDERGFGIRIYATGRKVYVVQARMAGRLRTVTIGHAAVLTRHQAAMVARRVRAHAEVGFDPAADRQRVRSAPRFDDFLSEYWRRWSARWKPATRITHDKYRRLYLDDAFPGLFIDALNEADVTRWFAALNNRIGPGGANRVMSILSNMLNKAEDWGYRLENTNPCRVVRLNRKRKCERFLSLAELEKLGTALEAARTEADPVGVAAAAAITLLLLTGCRVGEIANLQWRDIQGNRIKLRDSKTGPRTVWLGREARELVASLPKLKNIPWLFWNARYRRPLRTIDYYWREIRAQAGLDDVRLHDLRHTFASHAAMSKETLPMIGRLLGHTHPQSTARYAHLGEDHVLGAAEQIGAAIERMLS
ncbi:tyrosine-type recombinase/integrase [Sphingopyxis chilensis]